MLFKFSVYRPIDFTTRLRYSKGAEGWSGLPRMNNQGADLHPAYNKKGLTGQKF